MAAGLAATHNHLSYCRTISSRKTAHPNHLAQRSNCAPSHLLSGIDLLSVERRNRSVSRS
jgi:hypothetical protein